jgi:hypothetical protein
MMIDLPPPIQCFLERTNQGDPAGLLECFAPDANLSDWGRHYHRHEGVAAWDQADNIGVQSKITALDAERSGGAYHVKVRVAGNGFNGIGIITFRVEGEHITSMVIE